MRFSSPGEKSVVLWYTVALFTRSELLQLSTACFATGQNAGIKVQIVGKLLLIIRRGQKMCPWLVVYVW
jgi:hypothetical protein